MSIGTLVAFTALQGGLFRPLMGLLNVGVSLTASLALFARIFEYLEMDPEIVDAVGRIAAAEHRVARGRVARPLRVGAAYGLALTGDCEARGVAEKEAARVFD